MEGMFTGPTPRPPCEVCEMPKVWRGDARLKTGGYWKCKKDCPQKRGPKPKSRPEGAPPPRQRKPRPPRPPRPKVVRTEAARVAKVGGITRKAKAQAREYPGATQEWMTNPAVAVCSADGCFLDSATCPKHGRRRR